jgi:hypothetical protein
MNICRASDLKLETETIDSFGLCLRWCGLVLVYRESAEADALEILTDTQDYVRTIT